MKKAWMVAAAVMVLGVSGSVAMALGVDNKQTFSAAYVGSGSRNAALDGADIVYYNPAGIGQTADGLVVELNAQYISFDYDHTYNGETENADHAPIAPGLFAVYKKNNWAAFGSFKIIAGGSEVEYENGNSITEGIGNAAAAGFFTPAGYGSYEAATGTARPNSSFLMPGGTLNNEYAYVESYDYAYTAGICYRFNDIFSVAAAARYVTTEKDVDIHGTYNLAGSATYISGKYEQEADGIGGVFSINLRPNERVNMAVRYETKVNLDWHTSVAEETRGTVGENILWMNDRVDGKEYARDLPAVLGIGLEWQITPALALCPSYTLYLEKDADWGDTQNQKVDDNSYDAALALRYAFNDKWTGTVGYMYTDIGIEPEDYGIIEKMSPALDRHVVSLGGKYRMNDKLTFAMGIMGCFYDADTAGASGTTPEVEYEKEIYIVSLGLQYKFF